jgi:hypothetical protein
MSGSVVLTRYKCACHVASDSGTACFRRPELAPADASARPVQTIRRLTEPQRLQNSKHYTELPPRVLELLSWRIGPEAS